MRSWTLPDVIYPPLRPSLEAFLDELWSHRSGDLDFVVLFGSAARGQAGPGSDLDVLVGLNRNEGVRFIDRLLEFGGYGPGPVEAFPYYPEEVDLMQATLHTTFLEAVADGVVLHDRGRWARVVEDLGSLMRSGLLERLPRGWRLRQPEVVRERERAWRRGPNS